MKEIIIAISTFVVFFGIGVVAYYSGHPQIGEGIALISCIGLALWGSNSAAVYTPSAKDR